MVKKFVSKFTIHFTNLLWEYRSKTYFSNLTNIKIKQFSRRLCKDSHKSDCFLRIKLKHIFSFKDPTPVSLKSLTVYQFTCARCNSRCIGETSRHLWKRIKEHTLTDKNSHVFKHLNSSPNCKSQYTSNCFKLLYSAKTSYFPILKEAFDIKSLKPEVNTQVQYVTEHLLLLVWVIMFPDNIYSF